VFLAEDLQLNRKVTLKILAPELAADPAFRDRFVSESRIAASLEHPNILPIFEARESEGELFIATRFVRGADLEVLGKQVWLVHNDGELRWVDPDTNEVEGSIPTGGPADRI